MSKGWYWVRQGLSWTLAHHDAGVWSVPKFDEVGPRFSMDETRKMRIHKTLWAAIA